MKLLYCKKCHDIIKLQLFSRSCHCGSVSGKYINYIDIEVVTQNPKDVSVLGITNDSFYEAIHNEPIEDNGKGKEFTSFVIPKECNKINYVKEETFPQKFTEKGRRK